jgi:hypothetical protein
MITREMMINAIKDLNADATLWEEEDYCLEVTIEDFDGFDDDGSAVYRKYNDVEAVKSFLGMLEEECSSREDDYYIIYHFEDFDVMLGFASFDI